MKKSIWTSDFIVEGPNSILVKKTGHRIRLDFHLIQDIFTWFTFFFFAQIWRIQRALTGHKRPKIAFAPDQPRPWYLIWPVLHVAGARIVKNVEEADIVMQFDDSTETSIPTALAHSPNAKTVNFECTDISKSRVAEAFEIAAGYGLGVDPETYNGMIVDKSEINAAHDGRIVAGPFPKEEGRAYQRLVDNEIPGGLVEDLRTCTVNGEPAIVFIKRRPLSRRFHNYNTEVFIKKPQDVFSADELDVIRAFSMEIKLDWGGVDVLRDAKDGRIYIVDANKTDMGPPVALPLGEKLRATRRLARAFADEFAP